MGDLQLFIDALGGGPMAVGLAGLGFLYWRALKRIDVLTDKLIESRVGAAERDLRFSGLLERILRAVGEGGA